MPNASPRITARYRTGFLALFLLASASRSEAQAFKGMYHEPRLEPIWNNLYLPEIKRNGAGRVAINLVWHEWEPRPQEAPLGGPALPPCLPGQIEFDGRCFVVPKHVDEAIRRYSLDSPSEPGSVSVVAVLYGPPEWATQKRRAAVQGVSYPTACGQPRLPDGLRHADWDYCIPDDDFLADFARFAGMIAQRYGAGSPLGRIDDFVVWNEVNHRFKYGFDVGAPPAGYPGGLQRYWVDAHNCLFGKSFDQVVRFNPAARVYVYLDNYFGVGDFVNKPEKHSGFTIIEELARYGGERGCFQEPASPGPPRDWRVAAHAYSVSIGGDEFDPALDWRLDNPNWKFVTPATLGRLTGWLRKNHSDHSQGTLVSEVGFSSLLIGEERQGSATCEAYREALANPDIAGQITNRYSDLVQPCAYQDDCLGLRARDGRPKLAWHYWATMDRVSPYGCGFELRTPAGAVGVLLRQYVIAGRHRTTTRVPAKAPPPPEASWLLLRSNAGIEASTQELFECAAGAAESVHYASPRADCDGETPLGSLGFTYADALAAPNLLEIAQCASQDGQDYLVVPRRLGCPAGWTEPAGRGGLGWVHRSVSDTTVSEGSSSEAVFTVTLLSARYEPVTVGFATSDGTARAGVDYVAASGALTFQPGTTTRTVRVRIIDDDVHEPEPETFFLGVTGPAEVVVTGSQARATIVDDDALPAVSIDDRTVAEGSAVNAAFRVFMTGASASTVTVQYATANNTAVAGSDYTSASGTLTFTPGRTQHSILVPIVSDTTAEGDEKFFVNLSSPSAATLGTKSQGIGTIQDPPAAAKIAMYRSYNKSTDYHFFTTDKASKDFAVGTLGFQDESNPIPFYVWNTQQTGTTPLFRMYNPNLGRHFYTASVASRDFLMGIGALYEKEEGFVFPLSTTPVPAGATELFLLYNNNSGTHLFTADANQKNAILTLFSGVWVQHTSVGYVFTSP